MPSPLGHALAGLAVAWAADLVPGRAPAPRGSPPASWYRRAGGGLAVACVALAAAPDLDLLIDGYHRSVTHSFTAVAIVAVAAALIAAGTARPVARIASICAAAWATHLGLDWLGVDRTHAPHGVQLFWPFADAWFISGWDIFTATERRAVFSAESIATNAAAAIRELTVMLPIVLVLWFVRVKALAGFPSELARRDHSPQ